MKPLTMTEALESALRQGACEECFDSRAAEFLIDEIDALRRLPVIATCGDCMHADGMATTTCHYVEDAPRLAGMSTSPPPSWCPLRGAQ